MNQIITIKEIKGFSRVRAKVGWGGVGKACPGGVTPAETWLSGSRPGRPWTVVISPAAAEPGGPLGPGQGAPRAPGGRRARVFVSLVFSEASPTPSAVPSLTPNNLWASPGLCFPGVTASRTPGSRPGPSWVPHLTPPPAPAPYPLGDRGQRQPASRGRRAAPNRPGEPRENPGGSREIQPR